MHEQLDLHQQKKHHSLVSLHFCPEEYVGIHQNLSSQHLYATNIKMPVFHVLLTANNYKCASSQQAPATIFLAFPLMHKENEYTFKGKNSAIFRGDKVHLLRSKLFPLYTFTGRNSAIYLVNRVHLLRSKFFPLRADPIWEQLSHLGKQSVSHRSRFPLHKWHKNLEAYLFT